MKELEYPFDAEYIIAKRRAIRRQLLADGRPRIEKKIAVFGGSTTSDIVKTLELFLLDAGIAPSFYESEYAQYFQDAMFPDEQLLAFAPDVVFVHTSNRNVTNYPAITDSEADVEAKLDAEFGKFTAMWDSIREKFGCPIIQNNFEPPFFRLLGNRDAFDHRGRTRFLARLNERFAAYAASHEAFYINDLAWVAADYGLREFSNPLFWNMYKYAMCFEAIPAFAFNTANIIKSIFGRSKKALALDLDNTLWGGVVGDDGVDGIAIGQETGVSQSYYEFQSYLRLLKAQGVILRELNILPDSIVFADDNPAERAIVRAQVPGVTVPELDAVENYIAAIDRGGYFEVTSFTADDLKRNEMYKNNAQRAAQQAAFADYGEYLRSLEMTAIIDDFLPVYLERITQLSNKSNQFNLTTRRYTVAEMESVYHNPDYIRLFRIDRDSLVFAVPVIAKSAVLSRELFPGTPEFLDFFATNALLFDVLRI